MAARVQHGNGHRLHLAFGGFFKARFDDAIGLFQGDAVHRGSPWAKASFDKASPLAVQASAARHIWYSAVLPSESSMWLLYAFSGPVFWAISTHIDKYLVDRYF